MTGIKQLHVCVPGIKERHESNHFYRHVNRGATENVNYPHFSWEEASEMEKRGNGNTVPFPFAQRYGRYGLQTRCVNTPVEIFDRNKLRQNMRFFAYPYSSYNDFTFNAAQQAATFCKAR